MAGIQPTAIPTRLGRMAVAPKVHRGEGETSGEHQQSKVNKSQVAVLIDPPIILAVVVRFGV